MTRHRRFFSLAALVVGVGLIASGCKGDGSDAAKPSGPLPDLKIGFTEVAVPKALQGTTARVVQQVALQPPDAKSDPVIVSRSTLPGGDTSIQLWRPNSSPKPVGTINEPRATSLAAGASPKLAVIAGDRVEKRQQTMWAYVSADRSSWQKLRLDGSAKGLSLAAATAVDGRVIMTASNDDRADFVAIGDKSSSGRFVKLPEPTKGMESWTTSVAGHGSHLLAVRHAGPRGGEAKPYALVSPDLGKTWSEKPITEIDSVAGIVWTGREYVATGWVRSSGADKSVAAAVSSRDGQAWKAEKLPEPGNDSESVSRDSSSLSSPLVSAGAVQAQFTCICVASRVLERSSAGTWRSLGDTTRSHETDIAGFAWRSRSGPSLVVNDRGSLKHYSRSSVESQLSSTTLITATNPFTIDDVATLGNTQLVATSRWRDPF